MARRRVISDGHHGHYGHTVCSECGCGVVDNFTQCPHCKTIFNEETTYE